MHEGIVLPGLLQILRSSFQLGAFTAKLALGQIADRYRQIR
jgi:hypothetical protein